MQISLGIWFRCRHSYLVRKFACELHCSRFSLIIQQWTWTYIHELSLNQIVSKFSPSVEKVLTLSVRSVGFLHHKNFQLMIVRSQVGFPVVYCVLRQDTFMSHCSSPLSKQKWGVPVIQRNSFVILVTFCLVESPWELCQKYTCMSVENSATCMLISWADCCSVDQIDWNICHHNQYSAKKKR